MAAPNKPQTDREFHDYVEPPYDVTHVKMQLADKLKAQSMYGKRMVPLTTKYEGYKNMHCCDVNQGVPSWYGQKVW